MLLLEAINLYEIVINIKYIWITINIWNLVVDVKCNLETPISQNYDGWMTFSRNKRESGQFGERLELWKNTLVQNCAWNAGYVKTDSSVPIIGGCWGSWGRFIFNQQRAWNGRRKTLSPLSLHSGQVMHCKHIPKI